MTLTAPKLGPNAGRAFFAPAWLAFLPLPYPNTARYRRGDLMRVLRPVQIPRESVAGAGAILARRRDRLGPVS